MKTLLFLALFSTSVSVIAFGNTVYNQQDNIDIKQEKEMATLTSASRLFGDKWDLTSVILIIPSGSKVTILDSDSTYYHVMFEENDGYIFKRHAVINEYADDQIQETQSLNAKNTAMEDEPKKEISRFSYLENKYGSNMASRLIAGKIWKGMNSEMIKDSWGSPRKINRKVAENIIKEEWIYKNTWLYLENNTLTDWGPLKK